MRSSGLFRAAFWKWLVLQGVLTGCATPAGQVASTPKVTVTDGVASVSSTVALDESSAVLWVVNPDAGSVTPIDLNSNRAATPVKVGQEPAALAVTPEGDVVVADRASGILSVIRNGMVTATVELRGEPAGVALSPSGDVAYVTLSNTAELARVDVVRGVVSDRMRVGDHPWGIAVTDDGDGDDQDETVLVTHRYARVRVGSSARVNDGRELWLTLLTFAGAAQKREVTVPPVSFGFPNIADAVAVQRGTVWVPHLLNAPELPRTFDTTVSAALSQFSLNDTGEVSTLHLNDAEFSSPVNYPKSVALNRSGTRIYVVLAGSNSVMGINISDPVRPRLVGFWPAGQNPRGMVVNSAGDRGYVMNYLSRDVSVLNLADEVRRPELQRIPVVSETLTRNEWRGKVLFNQANDPRLSHLGWMSCASCHPDGGTDGTTWHTPDGPRQTQPLWSLATTAPYHASATRDEVQDFEEDIETLMNGIGLAPDAVGAALDMASAGHSADLDALATYVLQGIRVPDVAKSDAGERGRKLFVDSGCASCHAGKAWTDSHLDYSPGSRPHLDDQVVESLHDVGTFDPQDVVGARGFDTPTLLGIALTAPYLHDGTASSLQEVLRNKKHAPISLSDAEFADLISFLKTIDTSTLPFEGSP